MLEQEEFQEGKSFHFDWEDELPNTYEETCEFLLTTIYAVAITEPYQPFLIVDINDAWIDLCGYHREQVIGRSFRFMQGALTSPATLDFIVDQVNKGLPLEVTITNYKKSGIPFENILRIKPLRASSRGDAPITHFLATLQESHPE